MAEHEAVARTVHGLHPPLLPLHVKDEHVFLVVLGVARYLPEVQVEDVGGDHFLVPPHPVLLANEGHQAVVHPCSMGLPEATARGKLQHMYEVAYIHAIT